MAAREDLPEDIVLNIFSRLPVKSLIRFSSVSKRMHSIIFSDPKFAQLQFKAAAGRQHKRLLLYPGAPKLESLPLDNTTSFGDPSAVRKLALPFVQASGDHVRFLGSCNGLVFLAFLEKLIFIWNPSLGLFKQLPDPDLCPDNGYNCTIYYYGAAYLPAIDDYKVLVTSGVYSLEESERWSEPEFKIQLFSLRSQSWKRIESDIGVFYIDYGIFNLGIVCNNALHWLNYQVKDEMVCFDLVEEAFRTMPRRIFAGDGKSFSELGLWGECLCVLRYPKSVWDSIDFWVMKDYEASDSWTMVYSLKLSDPPNMPDPFSEFFVLGSSSVVAMCSNAGVYELIRIDHKKEDNRVQRYMLEGDKISMIEYEESLLWIGDYDPVQEDVQVRILETHHKA